VSRRLERLLGHPRWGRMLHLIVPAAASAFLISAVGPDGSIYVGDQENWSSNDFGSPGHISVVPGSRAEARWRPASLGWTSPTSQARAITNSVSGASH
jgi:hypothetical protein